MGPWFRVVTFFADIYGSWGHHDAMMPPGPLEDTPPALDALVSGMKASVLAEHGEPTEVELSFFRRKGGAIELIATFRFDGTADWRSAMLAKEDVPRRVRRRLAGAGLDTRDDYVWRPPATP